MGRETCAMGELQVIEPDNLSLIIPTRGRSAFLINLIQSIRKALLIHQGSLEIIIVDDDSAEPFQMENLDFQPPIRVVRSQKRQGPGAARNFGAQMARASSEWLLFLDDDVLIEEGYFKILSSIEVESDCVGLEGVTIVESNQSPFEVNPARYNFMGGFGSGNIIYRKTVFLHEKGFEGKFFHPSGIHFREDTDLGLRMLKHGKIHLFEKLRVVHMRGVKSRWFLLKDARKYYFESLFLHRNPDARDWIGTPFSRGRLGTYQMRGFLSGAITVGTLGLVAYPGFFLSLSVISMYISLSFLLARGYSIPLLQLPIFFVIVILYPWIHAFYYWKGFIELVLPEYGKVSKYHELSYQESQGQVAPSLSLGEQSAIAPKKGLKILQVVRVFHPSEGGMENFVKNLTLNLLRYGHQVDVLTLDEIPGGEDKLDGYTDLETDGQKIRIFRVRAHWYGPWFVPELSKIKFENYDLIHIHGVDGFLSQLTQRRRQQKRQKTPFILSTHGGFFHTKRWKWLKKIWFHTKIKRQLGEVGLVIASSLQDAQLFSKVHDEITIIENGVQIDDLLPITDRVLNLDSLLFVGGCYEYKGLMDLILFVEKARLYNPEIELKIIGDGPLRADLEAQVMNRNLQKSIRFLGRVSRERLRSSYYEAGVFISASRYEGFGLSVVEAMAAGCLLLLNQISAFEQIFKGALGGELVPFANLVDAVAAYCRLCGLSIENQQKISQSNQEYSRKYSWSSIGHEFERQYMAQLEEVTFPEPPGSL